MRGLTNILAVAGLSIGLMGCASTDSYRNDPSRPSRYVEGGMVSMYNGALEYISKRADPESKAFYQQTEQKLNALGLFYSATNNIWSLKKDCKPAKTDQVPSMDAISKSIDNFYKTLPSN
ncbi:MAG: hypothetical protein WCK90_02550 [archaeon]